MLKSNWLTLAVCSLPLTFACNKTEQAQDKALEARHEREDDQLAQRQEHEKEALERAQNKEDTALEQRQEALRPAATAVAAPGITANAVAAIAAARCTREQRCGNIGTNEDYPNVEGCVGTVSADWRDEVNAYECRGGIVQKEFDECLEAIRKEDCNSPLDTLARVVACRESDICKALD